MEMGRFRALRRAGFAVIALAATLPALPSSAAPYLLAPDTKITVNIIQWNPTKGEYQRWDPIGGTFVVSGEGTLTLPVIGTIDVTKLSSTDLAASIATSIKDKVGLLKAPEVTVTINTYPHFYVAGFVAAPGEYEFRPGLTVLQAMARSGGRYRGTAAAGSDVVSVLGELAIVRADYLRQLGEVARLEAEQAGKEDIDFPDELIGDNDQALVNEIVALEKKVLAARLNEARRQLDTLEDKRELLDQEIETLDARAKAGDQTVQLTEQQLEGIRKLYDKGVVTLGRQSDLEREAATFRVERLVTDTEIMKVRQGIADNQRQELAISDSRETNVAVDLRDARAQLNRLRSRKETLVRQIGAGVDVKDDSAPKELVFTIARTKEGRVLELPATETTLLQPGDVLKVALAAQSSSPSGASASQPEVTGSAGGS